MAPSAESHITADHRQQSAGLPAMRLNLETLAAAALGIHPRKLRNNSHKSWIGLGGDSLTAVNFTGACLDAGIHVDIPDVFMAETLDELLDGILQQCCQSEAHTPGKEELDYAAANGGISDGMRGMLNGSFDEVEAVAPCSPMQENMIALQKISPEAYQMQVSLTIASAIPDMAISVESVIRAWREVVMRHAALRTTFMDSIDRPGHLEQVVYRDIEPQVSLLPLADAEALNPIHEVDSKFPHHLILAPASEGKLFVRLLISHAIADGLSMNVIFGDLFRTMSGTPLPADTMTCHDLLQAQQADTSPESLSYWSRYTEFCQGTFLTNDTTKKKPASTPAKLLKIDQDMLLPPGYAESLSKDSNSTLVNACQVAFALVLRSYTGSNDVCFAYTTSSRQRRIKGLQGAVGNFVNTLPCRVDLGTDPTVSKALATMQHDFLESLQFHGADLSGKGQSGGGTSPRQLSDCLLTFRREVTEDELSQTGLAIDVLSWEAASDYTYTLSISHNKDRLGLSLSVWDWAASSATASNLLQLFCDNLDFVLNHVPEPCSRFKSLTNKDKSLITFCNKDPYPLVRQCVHDQVWAQGKQQPDASAIHAWDGKLTYRELLQHAERLSASLVRLGLRLEDKVGVCMDKSWIAPVAMLSILKAGGVVVPLGNQDTPDRIRTIVRNARISVLLADDTQAKRLEGIIPLLLTIDAASLGRQPPPADITWPDISPDNAAWVVHTSGSTGIPKGVVLEHKTLCSPMHVQAARYSMGPQTRALQFSAHTFDVVVKDIFTTLSFGGCVCIPSESQRLDDLAGAINSMKVNFATLTPTVASLLAPREVPTLDTIVATGEALSAAVLRPWLEQGRHVKWFNGYGPSECSHVSTINGPIARAEEAANIGLPAANRLWVVDPLDSGRLCPIGAIGELFIEGAIAREYLHDPKTTSAAFIQDPAFLDDLGLAPGRRMYRTGDLVRQNENGTLTYLGRRDTQLKIRGQRVEVADIEDRICVSLSGGTPLVCVDLVKSQDQSTQPPRLMAAFEMPEAAMPTDGPPGAMLCPATDELRDLLQSLHLKLLDEMPGHMVPTHLVPFAVLPKNASGKLDRRATREILAGLSDHELSNFKQNSGERIVATETERRLQALWAEVLGRPLEDIGNNDHFLQCGGDSVLAMRLVGMARKSGLSISVADVMQKPRLGDLASVVDAAARVAEEAIQQDSLPFELWEGFLSASKAEQQERLAAVASQCDILPSEVEDIYPASPLQEGLMAMTSQYPGTYVAQQVFRLNEGADVERFEAMWKSVSAALAILRTRIVYTSDSGSMQIVSRRASPWMTGTDLTAFLERDRTSEFGYEKPLHRFALINNGTDGHKYFVWTAHHSVYDGPTISNTLKIVARAFASGTFETATTPITRFVRVLRNTLRGEGLERARTFWRNDLQNAQLTRFPASPSPRYRPFADAVHRHRFQPTTGNGGTTGTRISLAILLRAAWALVVSAAGGNDEAMMAVVLSGRDIPVVGIEDMVAPTITTAPVRIRIDRTKTVVDYLSAVDRQSKDMAPHTQLGLANIRREVPDLGHDFDPAHLFVVHFGAPPEDAAAVASLGLERITGERRNFEGYPLVVECCLSDSGNGSEVEVETHFDSSVLSEKQVDVLMQRLEHVARQLHHFNLPEATLEEAQRNVAVGSLDIITPAEKDQLLEWNKPPPGPVQNTLDRLILEQIDRTPNAPAVCARGGTLTYAQLDAAADFLAQHLISLGVGPEVLVGLCMDKSEFAVVSMLAILRAGGAVVPLGVGNSTIRMQGLVTDADISVVCVDETQAARFYTLVKHPITVDAHLLAQLDAQQGDMRPMVAPRASPHNPAWVIFTSGSTGVPKGVVLEHRSLSIGILAAVVRFGMTTATRTFQFSAFTFDVSITDVLSTLVCGGCICMPSEKDRTDNLIGVMHDIAVTLAVLTPTVTSFLSPATVPASLDTIVLVGEAIKPGAVEPWGRDYNVFNAYGPAECSIYSVINGPVRLAKDAPIIGTNVSNRLWITHPQDHNSLVPLGSPGELLIEGPSLARSYLHDPKKTAASFIVDPAFMRSLGLEPGRRMYRTGDLVRQSPEDGRYVCLGRIDTQIKIRGQRVEVGEIETQIVRMRSEVRYACVDLVVLRNAPEALLLAAVELPEAELAALGDSNAHNESDQQELDLPDALAKPCHKLNSFLATLRSELAQRLPLYMIPTYVVPIMRLPVNPSGKLDRRATRELLATLSREQLRAFAETSKASTAARALSSAEEQLRLLWSQVLGLPIEEIGGADADFFERGGDSVAAMRLVAAGRRAKIPMKLGLGQILKTPRLGDMARVASVKTAATATAAEVKLSREDPKPFELWKGFLGGDAGHRTASLAAVAEQCEGIAGPEDIVDVYPATSLQEGLMAMTSKQSSAYVAQQVFKMAPEVDVVRLHAAWKTMSAKLAILRTRIVYTPQGPQQVVVKEAPQWATATKLHNYLAADQGSPFAYGTPLHRLAVIVEEDQSRYFVWSVHHAAYDGWTLSIALQMLAQTYRGDGGSGIVATPIPRFIRYLEEVGEGKLTAYWQGQLQGAQLTRFPPLPSPDYQPHAGSLLQSRLEGFSDYNRERGTGGTSALGVLLRAAWALTVTAYTGANEATINITLSGRDVPVDGIAEVVGPCLTTVPVRIVLNKAQTIDEFLRAIDTQAKDMVPFAHAGLHKIRNAVPGLGADFDAGHLFIIQPAPTEGEAAGLESIGLAFETDISDNAETRDFGGYALAVDCTVDSDSVHLEMRYDSEVLPHSRASALLSQLEHNIHELTKRSSETLVADLDLVSPADADIIRTRNGNILPATEACIHDLIQKAADHTPNAEAVHAWDGQFSFATLHAVARRLAQHLVDDCGVKPETKVGLCMDKSRWAIVSILAILTAGGAVLPLGIQQPVARVEAIVKDSNVTTILTDANQATRLTGLADASPRLLTVDAGLLENIPPCTSNSRVCESVSPNNAAWVVYTSGSTGMPKGVVLEHKSLCSSFAAHGPRVGFGPETRALQFSAFTFDNSIEDILSVLSVGGCVCVPSEEQRLNALGETICQMEANLLNTTPTVASLLRPSSVPSLKTLLLGGETVSPMAVEQWLSESNKNHSGIIVMNTYGPAECSVDVACSGPILRPRDAYTIGFPLGVHFWIVDPKDYNRLVPLGVQGELLIEGPHLGRGYINDIEKTEKAFVRDPDFVARLGLSPGRRMYRTGDLVRQNADGSLVHLGRIDTQIKIRGQRVETGEIESNIVLLEPRIRLACVDLIRPKDVSGDPMLVAAIDIGGDKQEPSICQPTDSLRSMVQDLREGLLKLIPHYMVPHFVPLSGVSLNASGKLDRKATRAVLESLNRQQIVAFEASTETVQERPLTPTEESLRSIWAKVLGCSADIGAHAHFIQLGGDSLSAMRIVAAAQYSGIRIGVADIFKNPRLSDLARVADQYVARKAATRDPAPFELWRGFSQADDQEKRAQLSRIAALCGVLPADIEDVYPTTPLQEGLMAVTADQPDAYFAQFKFRLRDVDMARLKSAWETLVKSLTIMRTRIIYDTVRGISVQVVTRGGLVWGHGTDLNKYLAQDESRPFAYGTPLHRLAFVETPDQGSYLVWTLHHSGYDGYQVALTLNMLANIYQHGNDAPLSPSPPPVQRFVQYLQQKDKKQIAAFWKQELGDTQFVRFPPVPRRSYRPEANGVLRARLSCPPTPRGGASLATLLRAAWASTVASYTGSTDTMSAAVLAARDIADVLDIGNMVAPTLTTVPLKTCLGDRGQIVADLLAAMELQLENMKPYLHTGMQHIRSAVPGLGVDFDPGHLLIVQPTMGDKEVDPLKTLGLEEIPANKADFSGYALAVQCMTDPSGNIDVEFFYDNTPVPDSMAAELLSQFLHNIKELDGHRDAAIGDLQLLRKADINKIREWNQPVVQAQPRRSLIHDLIQDMVEKQPNAPAVLAWDGELSYAELSKVASRLAHHLISLGVGPEVTVGVCMDKSLWAMVSMLAVLQAGGVIVALATQHPAARISGIVADAGIQVTFVDKAQALRLDGVLPYHIVVDGDFVNQLPESDGFQPHIPQLTPDNAAWIVYTSGSTGTPKGVVLEHKNICTGMISHGTAFGNNKQTRALQFASHTFGVVMEDMFTTLIFGGCTCIPSEERRLNMSELAEDIRRMGINFINVTSTIASLLDPRDVPGIETIVLGGEAVHSAVVSRWTGHAKVLNAYGQSECSVESVIGVVDNPEAATNIGFPIGGCVSWVVDSSDWNRLVPLGLPGELLVQGPLLARGYLNDPAKTSASFVTDPAFLARLDLLPGSGHRMYRTGDLVRQNQDGSLVYLGRADSQVKIRGQRVEPGEIESRISQSHTTISSCLVDLVRARDQPSSADPVLVAALELQYDSSTDNCDADSVIHPYSADLGTVVRDIRSALLMELPAYMVPNFFVPLSGRLPTNASGKLDRHATRTLLSRLTRDELATFGKLENQSSRPLSDTEKIIRSAFSEVLGRAENDIDPEDQFTQLGGSSIEAMHVVAACRRRGMVISVRDLLMTQTIAALSMIAKDLSHSSSVMIQETPVTSNAVSDLQQWMLDYHVSRPDVGMTYFSLDAATPLLGDRMVKACKQLFTEIEILHTGFVPENGKWKRVVLPSFVPDVQTYDTDDTIDDWTTDFMQRDGRKPIQSGQPLAEVAICSSSQQNGRHRVLFRLSHAIWDGMCIPVFWATLKELYETGQSKKRSTYTQYIAEVERHHNSNASNYWSNLLKGSTMTSIGNISTQTGQYVYRAGVIGPMSVKIGKGLPTGTTCATVLKAAWALTLAVYTKRNDIVFADLVSGRAGVDPSVADALGCCSTHIPVRVQLDPSMTYADLVHAVQGQQLGSIAYETLGFNRITRECTDWPAGTAATSWINHVPTAMSDVFDIDGTEYTLSQPNQEEKNWTFSEVRISWTQTGDRLEFHLVYAVDHVTEEAAQGLAASLESTIRRIIGSATDSIGAQLMDGGVGME